MRNWAYFGLIAGLLVVTGCLNFTFRNNRQISDLGNNTYQLVSSNLTMIVDASFGGRIVSLKIEGQEYLAEKGDNPHGYGSTLWTSPQKDWGWPPALEIDVNPYQVVNLGKVLKLSSYTSLTSKFQVVKYIEANPSDTSFLISYVVKNVSDSVQKAAAWEVTRVPGGGITFFECDTSTCLRPLSMPVKNFQGLTWFEFSPYSAARKLFTDGKGWLAHVNSKGMFVKTFENINKEDAAPVEAEVEVYANPGNSYIELENQSRYLSLSPGDSLVWKVKWYLRVSDTSGGSGYDYDKLKRQVSRLVK